MICKHHGSEWTCTHFFNGLVKNIIPDSLVPTRAIMTFIETWQILTADFSMSLSPKMTRDDDNNLLIFIQGWYPEKLFQKSTYHLMWEEVYCLGRLSLVQVQRNAGNIK